MMLRRGGPLRNTSSPPSDIRRKRAAVIAAIATAALWVLAPAFARGERLSDDAVRRAIIDESIAAYPSVCACPYTTMRNGRACGGRSSYSRPGGHAPICYPQDVSPEMIRRWRLQR